MKDQNIITEITPGTQSYNQLSVTLPKKYKRDDGKYLIPEDEAIPERAWGFTIQGPEFRMLVPLIEN